MNQAIPVYVCDALRTPFGRYGGVLASVRPDDLAAHTIRALIGRAPQLDPAAVEEVFLGCANQAGEDNRNIARMASLLAGLPDSVPGATINRLCGSGLDAVALGARTIASGDAEVVIAGGGIVAVAVRRLAVVGEPIALGQGRQRGVIAAQSDEM